MGSGARLFSSSIGRKLVMATTGLLLLGFVVAHLLGNLQIFIGPEKFNAYGAMLQSLTEIIWPARIGLLVVFILHITTAIKLAALNRAARPEGYRNESTVQATAASLYMVHTGLLILLFVLVHLAHYTLGLVQPEFFHAVDSVGRHDIYSMVIHGFGDSRFAAFYIVCMLGIGMHLSHGIASALQTLGMSQQHRRATAKKIGTAAGWLIALGYISIPAAVQLGVLVSR